MAFPTPMPQRLVLIGEPAGNGHEYLLEIAIFGNIAGAPQNMPQSSKDGARATRVGKMFFVILVDFQLKPGTEKQFRALIDANADASVRDEPGCLQFDVLEPEGETGRVLLYEIYCDRAAFEAHLKTGHFRLFNDASAEMVIRKHVTRCDLVCSGANVASRMGV